MSQTNSGLNNTFGLGDGVTPHYSITYDNSLSAADGVNRANALMGVCDSDYNWMSNLFGGIALKFSLPIGVQIAPGAYAGAGWPNSPPITLTPGNGQILDLVRYLLVSEVVEMFMDTKDNGWGYSFGDSNEGSKGEGLSRFLGFNFLLQNGLNTSVVNESGGTFFVSNDWLSSSRADFVNNNPDDNSPDPTTGCTTLFIYYLFAQLGFSIPNIINAGAATLAGVYTNLTGDSGDPFPFFKRLLDNAFPGTATITKGPNLDNPFPLGLLSFWVDKSVFGKDEVQDIINTNGGLIPNAFFVVLEGFNINSLNALGITIPAPTGAFAGLPGIKITPTPATPGGPIPANPIPEFEDPSNLNIPQRIRFSFDITFLNLDAFPATNGSPVTAELEASANVGGSALPGASASTLFELIGGEDPYFTNVDPSNVNDVFYLSQDLRVFTVNAGQAPVSGAQAFTSDPYGSLQSFLGFLNRTAAFTVPSSSDPLNNLPGQTGYETADSSVTALNHANQQNYNFAIARVRLKGAGMASAPNVRVFFRLFVAQSCDTDFQPNTTYKSQLGTSGPDNGLPVFPLASGTGLVDPSGQSLQTIPFFSTSAAGTHDYDSSVPNGNIRNLQLPSGKDSLWAYYGCFLDVFDSSNNSKFGGTHHCIVAQIAFDQSPIPTTTPAGVTLSPANFDKLAQRNLQITKSENPKSPATHIVPQAFDTRPSKPVASQPGDLTDYPDELMIDWGNTPPGSVAYIYWPQVNAGDVLTLANSLYSSHLLSVADPNTVLCLVTDGVTYVPIPPATGVNFAGLFTVDLPTSITKGQEFNILVRRVTTRRATLFQTSGMLPKGTSTQAKPAVAAVRRAVAPVKQTNWRYVVGAFQVKIPVTTKSGMLRDEENTLAVIKWRLENMSPLYRWRPVLERYLTYVTGRVQGLGGNPNLIPPSLQGAPGGPVPPPHPHPHPLPAGEAERTGKVAALIFDRFGDFEGFLLRTESGQEHAFKGHEREVEELIRCAWRERFVISVVFHDHDPHRPVSILLRRAPHQP